MLWALLYEGPIVVGYCCYDHRFPWKTKIRHSVPVALGLNPAAASS